MNTQQHNETRPSGLAIALVASALFLGGCDIPQPETVLVTPATLRDQPRLLKTSSFITLEVVGQIEFQTIQPVGKGQSLLTFNITGDNKEPIKALFLTDNASTIANAQKSSLNGFGKVVGKFLTNDPLTIEIQEANNAPCISLNRPSPVDAKK